MRSNDSFDVLNSPLNGEPERPFLADSAKPHYGGNVSFASTPRATGRRRKVFMRSGPRK